MSEKQKYHPKASPKEKKSHEKEKTLTTKKEFFKEKKECKIDTRKKLTKICLHSLKNDIWNSKKSWNLRKVSQEKAFKKEIKHTLQEVKTKTQSTIQSNSQNHEPIEQIEKKSLKNSQTIFKKNSPLLWDKLAYKNETEIKKNYWKDVKKLITKYCQWSVIDEKFLYWVIARESRFNKNAKSYTGVKWLWQLTNDTIKTVVNINEAKVRNNPTVADLHITDGLKNKKWKLDKKEILKPINQIKFIITYLSYLEDLFVEVKDKNFKTDLIITSYNLWPWKTKEIFDQYYWVKNWAGLKKALERASNNGKISEWKLKEVAEYVPAVRKYILLASL